MKPKALLKRVIVKAIEKEHKTEGGIVLPETYVKDQVEVLVVSKGSEAANDLAEGDIVLIDGYQGHDIVVDGEKYKVIEDNQILAVLEDEQC